jgi:hypothetical protein
MPTNPSFRQEYTAELGASKIIIDHADNRLWQMEDADSTAEKVRLSMGYTQSRLLKKEGDYDFF